MKQKTALALAIKKFKSVQKEIMSDDKYSDGYFGALSDCISVLKELKPTERKQIEEAYIKGGNYARCCSLLPKDIKESSIYNFDETMTQD